MNRSRFLIPVVFFVLLGTLSARCCAEIAMSGDSGLDCDSISNSDSNQWRWLSFPGSRFSLNPAPGKEVSPVAKWDIPPMAADLPLNIGGFIEGKATRFWNILTLRVSGPDGGVRPSNSRSSAWFPYKVTFDAAFPGEVGISGCDFFALAGDAIIREMQFTGPSGSVITCEGKIVGESAQWDAARGVLLVSGSNYFYALKPARLDGLEETASSAARAPKLEPGKWSISIPMRSGTDALAVAFGFATVGEGGEKAVARACGALAVPVKTSLAKSKATLDSYLRRVPAPTHWGIAATGMELSPAQHRRAYYAAWAFLVQNLIDVLPENPDYPFPQVAAGKPALWDEGEKTSSATCSWESLFGYQWLSFLEPDIAWRAYDGLMTRVDANGKLGGESLPSRKAQTAWILFKNKPDSARLKKVYPAIKRYLLWREQNPRWIYGSNLQRDEKDIEFTVSWLFDVNYAIRIAGELGIEGEKDFWMKKQASMIENMRRWFFADNEKIQQFYFAESKTHATKTRFSIVPMMIDTALSYKNLPENMAQRVLGYFHAGFNPAVPLGGFGIGKHPDLNLAVYGLLDRNVPESKAFIQRFLRDNIAAGEFCEQIESGAKAEGVKPSLFSPLNIIEFTWLLNNVRYESGTPTAFEFAPFTQTAKQ